MCINNNVAAVFMPRLDNIVLPWSTLVVLQTDLTKHEFRLFTNRHHDVFISASFWDVYCNNSNIYSFWDHNAVVNQINSADVWLARDSEYLLILTHQLWTHRRQMESRIFTINTNDPAVKFTVLWTVVLCTSTSCVTCSEPLFFPFTEPGLCMTIRFFSACTQNRQLVDYEEIFYHSILHEVWEVWQVVIEHGRLGIGRDAGRHSRLRVRQDIDGHSQLGFCGAWQFS